MFEEGAEAQDEHSMSRVTGEGVKVECLGAARYRGDSILTVVASYFGIVYRVTTPRDMVITIGDGLDAYDANGERFSSFVVVFGNKGIDEGNIRRRELIEGVPTLVIVWYSSDDKGYKLTETYPRVSFAINGEDLTFRGVPLYK
jgi:hypothetical protein